MADDPFRRPSMTYEEWVESVTPRPGDPVCQCGLLSGFESGWCGYCDPKVPGSRPLPDPREDAS